MTVKMITATNFDKEVLQSDVPCLVKFSAAWCSPCRLIMPLLETIAEELSGKAKIVEVDVDDDPELATQYKIKSIPAMIVFKDGKIIGTQVGRAPKENIVKLFGLEEKNEEEAKK